MGDIIEISTYGLQPSSFYKVTSSAINFEIKGLCLCMVGLAKKPGPRCDYSVGFAVGGGNLEPGVGTIWVKGPEGRKSVQGREHAISQNHFKKYWLSWEGGKLKLGQGNEADALCILSCAIKSIDFNYIAFTSHDSRQSATWRIELPPLSVIHLSKKIPYKKVEGGDLHWEPGRSVAPEDAVVGGFQNECLYIIRGHHAGSLTPGLFVPSIGLPFLSWGGGAHNPLNFEILAGFNYAWEKTTDSKIPANAFEAGYSEVRREKLYIGRVQHEGHMIPGKVQPSHKVCYVVFDDKEVAFKKYEILTVPDSNLYPARPHLEPIGDWRIDNNTFRRNGGNRPFPGHGDDDDDNSNYDDEEHYGVF